MVFASLSPGSWQVNHVPCGSPLGGVPGHWRQAPEPGGGLGVAGQALWQLWALLMRHEPHGLKAPPQSP